MSTPRGEFMKKLIYCSAAVGLILFMAGISRGDEGIAKGDELRFTDLPGAVQRTVIAETRISSGVDVVRVVQDANGIYAITVQTSSGQKTVYVSDWGRPVQCPIAGR
jgi:hypothetical protein